MPEQLFLQILNMSFTGGIIILFVVLARLLLRKAPKVFSYALWAVVLFRLICPFSFESIFSLLPTNPSPITPDIVYSEIPKISTGIAVLDNTVSAALPAAIPTASVNPLQIWNFIGSFVWLLGIAVLLIYSVVSLLKLKRRLKGAVHEVGNIYLSDSIDTPFVMGFVRPKIYLPFSLGEEEKQYIILHEQTHIKRLDHVVKILSFFVLCLHWFNPLVWAAFFLSGKDMEMSCDEAVIKNLGADVKKEYSSTLLSLATGRRIVGATPLAFGEGDTKGRIKNVLNFKKPTAWVVAVAVIAVITLCVGLMTNPKNDITERNGVEGLWKNRTEYVGNNSKVVGIIYELSFPENLQYDGFALDTKAPPYGVTVKFKTDTDTRNYYTGALHEAPLQRNAIIMFSLIENAERIVFTLDDGQNPYSVDYTRAWAEDFMGGGNLFACTETFEGFGEFVKEVSLAVNNSIAGNNGLINAYGANWGTGSYETVTKLVDQAYIMAQDYYAGTYPASLKKVDKTTAQVIANSGTNTPGFSEVSVIEVVFNLPDTEMYVSITFEKHPETGEWNPLPANALTVYDSERWKPKNDSDSSSRYDDLDAAVSAAILEANKGLFATGDFAVETHTILATEAGGAANSSEIETVTVYAIGVYLEFTYSDTAFSNPSGGQVLVAVTFEKDKQGLYKQIDYWVPRDRAYNSQAVKERFPAPVADEILSYKNITTDMIACYEKAIAYAKLDTSTQIAQMIKEICSSPATASNPGAYISAHQREYDTLVNYGDYTLRYCFDLFEKGGQTGLEGHIMASACKEILTAKYNLTWKGLYETGQDWYDGVKNQLPKLH